MSRFAMVPTLLALSLALFLVTVPQEAAGQSPEFAYSTQAKSELGAVALELVFPVLGHAYAGNAQRGLIPALASVGGLVIMFAGASDLDGGMVGLGTLVYLGGRGWGVVSAHNTAKDHNMTLRRELGLAFNFEPGPEPGSVGLKLSVPAH